MPSINMVAATLHGERQRNEVFEQGYTVTPFLDEHDIESLLALHAETHIAVPHDFYVSALDPYEVRRRICEGIAAVLHPKLDRLVSGYRILLASFVTKKANSTHGKLEPHQDYSLIDQSKHLALNIWVPLCKVDIHNACMRMVDYSQRFDHISATSKNPSVYSNLIHELETNYLTDVPMAAGDALIFDSRALHATGENETPRDRPAVLFSVVPAGAQPLLYFWNDQVPARLEVYEADTDFLLRLPARRYPTPQEKQRGKFRHCIDYAPVAWTVGDLERLIPRRRCAPQATLPAVAAGSAPVRSPATAAAPSFFARLRNFVSGRLSKPRTSDLDL